MERREGELPLAFSGGEQYMMGWVLQRREAAHFDGFSDRWGMGDLNMLLRGLQRENRDVLAEAIWRVVESTYRTGHLPQITEVTDSSH